MFTTAPSQTELRPFTFTAFADQGVNTDPTPTGQTGFSDNYYKPDDTRRTAAPSDALVALIAARHPAFHLLAGDICYADPSGSGYPVKNNGARTAAKGFDNFDPTVWTQYFGVIEKSAATVPWLFAHSATTTWKRSTTTTPRPAAESAARLCGPRRAPRPAAHGRTTRCPSVYSVVYGNVGILSLDANDLSTEVPTNAGYSGGAQVARLTQRLSELRGDPRIDFIVVFFHHCAYATSSAHASDAGVRAALAPLFDRFSVDLVVQGHNHSVRAHQPDPRRGPLHDAGARRDESKPATNGTTYICCGSGGRPRYAWQPGETPTPATVARPAPRAPLLGRQELTWQAPTGPRNRGDRRLVSRPAISFNSYASSPCTSTPTTAGRAEATMSARTPPRFFVEHLSCNS